MVKLITNKEMLSMNLKFRIPYFSGADKINTNLANGRDGYTLMWGEGKDRQLLVLSSVKNSDDDIRHVLHLFQWAHNPFNEKEYFDKISSEVLNQGDKSLIKTKSAAAVACMKVLRRKIKDSDHFSYVFHIKKMFLHGSPVERTMDEPESNPGSAKAKAALKELNALPRKKGISQVTYEDIKKFEKVLEKFPPATVLTHAMEAGTEKYEKISSNDWKVTYQPWGDTKQKNSFDVAQWMAGSGYITRGAYKLQ